MREKSESQSLQKLRSLSTTQISDALDSLGLEGVIVGIHPLHHSMKIVGPAVTVKMVAQRYAKSSFRRSESLEYAKAGDVLVYSGGRVDVSRCGSLASFAAKTKGVEGFVIDGACRDAEEIMRMRFPVFCRRVVPLSGRGRIAIESVNEKVNLGRVQVSPGDLVIGDGSGVVVVQRKKLDKVLRIAYAIAREERMIRPLIPRYKSLTLAREALRK